MPLINTFAHFYLNVKQCTYTLWLLWWEVLILLLQLLSNNLHMTPYPPPLHRHITLKIIITKKDKENGNDIKAKSVLVLFRISLVLSSNIIQRRLSWFNLRTNFTCTLLHPVFGLT